MRSPKQTTGSSADQLLTIANSIRDRQVSAPDFSLILMSNMAPQRQFEAIIRTLPRGVCVLYRDYLASERAQQAKELKRLCAERECPFLIAGDPELARAVQADGIHVPSWQLRHYQRWSGFRGIITAACHNVEQLRLAALGGADAVLISPVFPTSSHPGQQTLGLAGFKALAARSSLPVFGLGAMTAHNAPLLKGPNLAGFAAISAFAS